jgi:hypothetical protein
MREQLRPKGWTKSGNSNYELTVNKTDNLAIVVATGDDATGLIRATPSNKCSKGINTTEAVEVNNQLDLFSDSSTKVEETKSLTTWVLLIHLAADELRSELSLPSNISNGKFNEWKERVILPSMPLDDDSVEIELPNLPDIEVLIRKKA